MNIQRPQRFQLYNRSPGSGKTNGLERRVQSNGVITSPSPELLISTQSNFSRQEHEEKHPIRSLMTVLPELDTKISENIDLTKFQKAQLSNMLVSTQSLIESLSIQYSGKEMPQDAYRKLCNLVDNIENLIWGILNNNRYGDGTKYGIFQDRISNLSPSVSSKSIGGHYEEDLVGGIRGLHMNREPFNEYSEYLLKESDEDSEFDDEEVDLKVNEPTRRYGIQNELKRMEASQLRHAPRGNSIFSGYATPTRSTIPEDRRNEHEAPKQRIQTYLPMHEAKHDGIVLGQNRLGSPNGYGKLRHTAPDTGILPRHFPL